MKRFRILCGAVSLLLAFLSTLSAQSVPQWGRFERSITNTAAYADPYRNVTLNVVYTAPGGAQYNLWGFYDGPQTWKIRFMPHLTGTWSYAATFSDGQPGVNGTFTCASSSNRGTVSAYSANPRWFGHKSGQAAMIRSFHAANLFRFSIDDPSNPNDGNRRTLFLNWAETQGYNTFSATSHFSTSDAAGPKLWPLNFTAYQKVEAILNDLSSRGMMVHGFGGFFPASGEYPATATDRTLYIRYCLARFAPYWNEIWNVGGPEPNLNNYISATLVREIGAAIKAGDPFGHLLGVHNKDGDDPYRSESWTSYATIQDELTNLADVSALLLRNYAAGKPVYAHETIWMGNTLQPAWTLTDLRKHMWVHMMSAATINVGDMAGNNTSGFGGSLNLADKIQERHDIPKKVWDYMESIPFYRMSPRQDLRNTGYMLAEVGQQYLCYLPSGGSVNITVASSGAPYRVTWINADNPMGDQRAGGTTTNGQGLAAPNTSDWLAYLVPNGSSGTQVNLVTGDTAAGQTSFNTGAKWSDGQAPQAGKTYVVSGLDLRSPATSGTAYTFLGDSLTVQSNGRLLIATTNATVTVNNLRLNGGSISTPVSGATVTLGGVITSLASGAGLNTSDTTRTLSAAARLTGSGLFTINPVGNGTVILTGTGNNHSGGTTVTQGTLVVRRDAGLGTGNVTVANGATLRLEQGSTHNYIANTASLILGSTATANLNFTGTDAVNRLSLDSGATYVASGVWGAVGSGAANTSSRLTGTGRLSVGTAAGSRGPLADAYVRDGTYAGQNFGGESGITVKLDGAGFARESFLRFDVSGLANVSNAKVVLIPTAVGTDAATTTLAFDLLTSDGWTESGITWTNRPTAGSAISSQTGYAVGQAVELNVTTQAKAQAAGDGLLSLRIRSTTSGSQRTVTFGSKENTISANRPVLQYAP